ncbi:hypothetical protein SLITO_v1c07360 [Spiroplasma litorale]|uniref:ABC3 transporter permease C-terminal domain-containing protein n=1 Tax=Spiroplasma litorale TaxID=216942 RepID=A0A0K1W2F7_9MOLU|nr:ABC transporter permease [Spiroplasma litorale]AKX34361.1 hypothetical protein SLITO_v1c07360 [Spiroplasma litorale]
MLLFKNGLRKLLKDYTQFTIYIVLIFVSVIFTSTFGIVASNLISSNDNISKNFKGFDYSYRFNSSGYKSNDTQTFSPWFAFNTELVKNNSKISEENMPTLNFGNDKALQEYYFNPYCENSFSEDCYDSSVYSKDGKKNINFHFGDVEGIDPPRNSHYYPSDEKAVLKMTNADKFNIVKRAKFGDLYKFNLDSTFFKESLIGKLYAKFNNFDYEFNNLSKEAKKSALDIFDFMFYLNNSFVTYSIKKEILDIYNTQDKIEEKIEKINSHVNQGFNKKGEKNDVYYTNSNLQKFTKEEKALYNKYASVYIRNYESEEFFKTLEHQEGYIINSKHLTSRNWFDSFMEVLGDLTNFDTTITNEVVMWGLDGEKYRYISSFYNTKIDNKYKVEFYNSELNTIYEKIDGDDVFTENSYLTSLGHYRNSTLSLGKSYNIFPGDIKDEQKYRLDGIMTNALNLYPTIYEEDLMVNQENSAIFYISTSLYGRRFRTNSNDQNYIDPSKYQDVSRVYLKYHDEEKTNVSEDVDTYKLYLADNILNLGKIVEQIKNPENELKTSLSRANIQSFDELTTLKLRSSLFNKIVKIFYWIAIVFSFLFVISLCFVIQRLFKKVMDSQRSQIGNLKSLGYSNMKIVFNYIAYMCIPVFLIVPVGWGVSLFVQKILNVIFATYFEIPETFSVNWIALLAEFGFFLCLISIMVFLVSYFKIRQSPLKLLEPPNNAKPRLFLTKIFSKFKFISFKSKLRNIIFASSFKDLISFFFVMFLSTIVLSISTITPNILKEMSTEYYKNMNYNNEYGFSENVSNNPFSRYAFYNSNYKIASVNNDASIFNIQIQDKKTNKYHSLIDPGEVSYWKSNSNLFAEYIQDAFLYNLATFKGTLVSPAVLENVIDLSKQIDATTHNVVSQFTNTFACRILPQLFNQQEITDEKDFNNCIKSISGNILPSSIKERWDRNEDNYKNFSFNFSKIPFNKEKDSLYTKVNVQLNKKDGIDAIGYGIDLNNKSNLNLKNKDIIKYSENQKDIPIIINRKLQLQGYSVGSYLNSKLSHDYLTIIDNNKSPLIVDKDWWSLENSNSSIWDVNLSKLTYWKETNNLSNFYYEEDGDRKEFVNPKNILLKLPKSQVNNEEVSKINEEYTKYSNKKIKEDSSYYYINPFDIYIYEDDGVTTMPLFNQLVQTGLTNSWLNIALKNSVITNTTFYDDIKNLKIVGVDDFYDGYKFYFDQLNANKLLGYNNFDSVLNIDGQTKINIWSNAKISTNETNSDQLEKIILNPDSGNNTMAGFIDYMKQAINQSDSINTKKDAINKLLSSVISIATIFISISMIAATIVIFLITDIFIGRYKTFMANMRIFGYSMREINSIIIWIFLPIAFIASLLAIGAVILLIYLIIPEILVSVNIAVPMIFNYVLIPGVFLLSLTMFLISYISIIFGVSKIRLASLIGNES